MRVFIGGIALFSLFLLILIGFVTHLDSPTGFAVSSGFTEPLFSVNNNLVDVVDDVIFHTGYYSVNGASWVPFGLSGSSYEGSSYWLGGSATHSLPDFGVGTHFVLVYSCSLVDSSWDCHDNKWQLKTITLSLTNTGSNDLMPENLYVTGSGNRARLTWDGMQRHDEVDAYRIERRVLGGNWDVVESNYVFPKNPLPYIYYDDIDLILGQTYEYRVASVSKNILSDYGASDSVSLKGSVYYVSSSGDVANSGISSTSPWPMSKLLRDYEPGDLILFKQGDTFNFPAMYLIGRGDGTKKNPIRWDSYGSGTVPLLIGSGRLSLSLRDMSHWVISNLHITGGTELIVHVSASSRDITNLKFLNLYVDGKTHDVSSFGAGIHFYEQGASNQKTSTYFIDDVEVAYSTIVNAGQGVGNNDGVRLWATRSNGHIHNNKFEGNGGDSVDIAGGLNHVVEYNVMQCGTYTHPLGAGSKSHGQQHHLENFVYRGNLVYYCNNVGLSIQDSKNGLVEQNTVFMGNYGYGSFIQTAGWHPEDHTGNIIRNNIFVGARSSEGPITILISDINDNGETHGGLGHNWYDKFDSYNNIYEDTGGYIARFYDLHGERKRFIIDTHEEFLTDWVVHFPKDIHADPLFVDMKNSDFRLQSNSLAIGRGAPNFMFDCLTDSTCFVK